MSKKGQVTVFVIIGIVIVVGAILVYAFFPEIKSTISGVETNPAIYIQNCLEDEIVYSIQNISLQGGELNPTNYYLFNDSKVNYLCQASDYYIPCVVQTSFVKESIEMKLTKELQPVVNDCFASLEEEYTKKGYSVTRENGPIMVKILPDKTELTMNHTIAVSKDTAKTYDGFSVVVNNNLYEVLGVVRSIVEFESSIGEAETTEFMSLYRDLKVEKLKQSDETKIYIITDKPSGDKFQFASRSLAFPPGYL
ncbi:MAG: hypothetical protein PF542_07045 [Nanoarchaeota archaeon]|jgi:hypothetical protein|nr:hypothetical protein [Nanoarchaeota archaeon]